MSKYRKTWSQIVNEVYKVKEQEDHEISMARGELEAIADKALKLSSLLQGKSDDGNPLEAWVQSKITKAKDYINSVADYMEYDPSMAKEETELKEYTTQQIKQAYGILNDPRYKQGNYDGAVAAIEKLAKGLSKQKDVANALKRANEEVELDEKVADSIIRDLQKAYAPLKGKTISTTMADKMSKHLDQPSYDLDTLRQLVKANIPFISTLAKNKIYKKTGKFEETELTESHYKVGDKVKCKASGMSGEVIKLDKPDGADDEKYYTVKRSDGTTMKYAPNELTKENY